MVSSGQLSLFCRVSLAVGFCRVYVQYVSEPDRSARYCNWAAIRSKPMAIKRVAKELTKEAAAPPTTRSTPGLACPATNVTALVVGNCWRCNKPSYGRHHYCRSGVGRKHHHTELTDTMWRELAMSLSKHQESTWHIKSSIPYDGAIILKCVGSHVPQRCFQYLGMWTIRCGVGVWVNPVLIRV